MVNLHVSNLNRSSPSPLGPGLRLKGQGRVENVEGALRAKTNLANADPIDYVIVSHTQISLGPPI